MKLDPAGNGHLTYCTNIHPGETWPEVRNNLEKFLPEAKAELSLDAELGVGLRLSAVAARELADDGVRVEFKNFLRGEGLYVFTLNGFPYGEFHGTPVKENVYLPDWRTPERLDYTNLLADILADILPGDVGLDGSVSTVPGGFKAEIRIAEDIAVMADNMVRHAAHLVELRRKTGNTIILTLEPEPCCHLETIDETVAFFRDHLHSPAAAAQLADLTGLEMTEAEAALHRHLGVCLDLCHAAVEFEEPADAIAKLRDADIRVGKMQISAGLRFSGVDAGTVELLRPFADEVYLHQTVAAGAEGLERFVDLPDAFASEAAGTKHDEWRVHFHVPIFLDDMGAFATTQNFIREVLALHRESPISDHLEVETYTWDVLPEAYRNVDVVSAIVRELQWVRSELAV